MSLQKLVWKELLNTLRNPQILFSMIIIPIMFVAMGSIISAGVEEAAKTLASTKLAIVLEDASSLAEEVATKLEEAMQGRALIIRGAYNYEALGDNYIVLILSKGFSEALKEIKPPVVKMVVPIKGLSMAASGSLSIASTITEILEDSIRSILLERMGSDPRILELRVRADTIVEIGRLRLNLAEANALISSVNSSFFVALIMVAIVMQYSALSMAQEKEDKTFETLLSQPIRRLDIGIAKVVGSIALSLVQMALFVASWYYYMEKITGSQGEAMLSLTAKLLGVEGIITFFLSIFLAMVGAAIIGLIAGSLAQDTRSAGVVIGPLWFIVIALAMAFQMIGLPANSLAAGLLGLTVVATPVVVFLAVATGSTTTAYTAMAFTIAAIAVLFYLLSRMLESEIMVIGLGFTRKLGKRA